MSSNITMRIDVNALQRIDQAARMSGKNRTQFILEEALRKADELLPDFDAVHYELSSVDYQAVLTILEETPDENKRNKLLEPKGLPWNKS
ncbi:DUF1778 domain-containing protein [uncultured Cardiobacterium sp.]|uniref:type II toxin-antitoxin system TacA family antitoxin n=1 Tax=uncultured Cardiobacterium sp. TaxID=417619 RepID=UPI002634D3F3|nr:DUF1778 domain-containing protein [uncultured Cardiobacterium sp.]